MHRIPLIVEGVNLESDDVLERIDRSLSELAWTEVDGRVIAILHTDQQNLAGAAVQAARQIENNLQGACVREVDQDLVSVSDIAHRVGMSRETVRLWVEGRRGPGSFPGSIASPGTSRVWRWEQVAGWVNAHYGDLVADDDEELLTFEETLAIDSALVKAKEHLDSEWEVLNSPEGWLTPTSAESVPTDSPRVPSLDWELALKLVDFERIPLTVVPADAPDSFSGSNGESSAESQTES